MTDLINAVKTGDVAAVESAIEQRADINAKDEQGETALTAAAEAGNSAIVKKLLAAGAQANSQ
jgi:ankyrin repeat protein